MLERRLARLEEAVGPGRCGWCGEPHAPGAPPVEDWLERWEGGALLPICVVDAIVAADADTGAEARGAQDGD